MMRQAISPRLAIRIRLNIVQPVPRCWLAALQQKCQLQPPARNPADAGTGILAQAGLLETRSTFSPILGRLVFARACVLRMRRPALILSASHSEHEQFHDRRSLMALAIGDTAPDFEAETTEGRIKF